MEKHPASFRDPGGFVFEVEGELFRNIDASCKEDFDLATSTDLYNTLFERKLLIPHNIVHPENFRINNSAYVIKPKRLQVITYASEWSYSQLKDAAILTLDVLETALRYNLILKDGSSSNVQFSGHSPIFIDTLSFTRYNEGAPWLGYRQFCEHFIAPLSLAAHLGVDLLQLNRIGCGGINLSLASRLLPARSLLNPSILLHIHLHAKYIDTHRQRLKVGQQQRQVSRKNLLAMIDHLRGFLTDLRLPKDKKTQWQDYEFETHYSIGSRKSKLELVKEFIAVAMPSVVWDIGANAGLYSHEISSESCLVLSLDSDYAAIEKNYLRVKELKISNVFPLFFDAADPAADSGWASNERPGLLKRIKPDCIVALAVIHHLAITHNVPLEKIASYFAHLGEWLIIEFVPPDDQKVMALPDTGGKLHYSYPDFRDGFARYYCVMREQKIEESGRTLLLMRKK